MKPCSLCKAEKPPTAFYPDKSKASGLSSRCRECSKTQSKARHEANLEASRARMRAYGATPEARARRREIHAQLRTEVFAAYGDECACCGESSREFLTVDHVGGWGAEHRKTIGDGTGNIYRWLKRNGYPQERFRLLCWNCNCAMGIHGYCPHERTAPDAERLS